MPLLIYIRGMFGNVETQILYQEQFTGSGSVKKENVLAEYKIEDWEANNLTFDELCVKYPFEDKEEKVNNG